MNESAKGKKFSKYTSHIFLFVSELSFFSRPMQLSWSPILSSIVPQKARKNEIALHLQCAQEKMAAGAGEMGQSDGPDDIYSFFPRELDNDKFTEIGEIRLLCWPNKRGQRLRESRFRSQNL